MEEQAKPVANVEFLEWPELKSLCAAHSIIGSRAISGFTDETADLDFLCLVAGSEFHRFIAGAAGLGFQHEKTTDIMPGVQLASLRKGNVNLLITQAGPLYSQFLNATALANKYAIVDKAELNDFYGVALYGAFGWVSTVLGGKPN